MSLLFEHSKRMEFTDEEIEKGAQNSEVIWPAELKPEEVEADFKLESENDWGIPWDWPHSQKSWDDEDIDQEYKGALAWDAGWYKGREDEKHHSIVDEVYAPGVEPLPEEEKQESTVYLNTNISSSDYRIKGVSEINTREKNVERDIGWSEGAPYEHLPHFRLTLDSHNNTRYYCPQCVCWFTPLIQDNDTYLSNNQVDRMIENGELVMKEAIHEDHWGDMENYINICREKKVCLFRAENISHQCQYIGGKYIIGYALAEKKEAPAVREKDQEEKDMESLEKAVRACFELDFDCIAYNDDNQLFGAYEWRRFKEQDMDLAYSNEEYFQINIKGKDIQEVVDIVQYNMRPKGQVLFYIRERLINFYDRRSVIKKQEE